MTRALSFVGTAMLSITPLDLNRRAILLMVDRLTQRAKDSLRGAFGDTAFLDELADSMAVRRN